MAILKRDDILSAKLPTREVDVPEWGGTVRVRGLDGLARDRFDMLLKQRDELGAAMTVSPRAFVAMSTIVDEDGNLVFGSEDFDFLSKTSGHALDRIVDVALPLSGIGAKSIEDAEKNSEGGLSGSGGSASPPASDAQSANCNSA